MAKEPVAKAPVTPVAKEPVTPVTPVAKAPEAKAPEAKAPEAKAPVRKGTFVKNITADKKKKIVGHIVRFRDSKDHMIKLEANQSKPYDGVTSDMEELVSRGMIELV